MNGSTALNELKKYLTILFFISISFYLLSLLSSNFTRNGGDVTTFGFCCEDDTKPDRFSSPTVDFFPGKLGSRPVDASGEVHTLKSNMIN